MLKVRDLRRSFIDYFAERGHKIVPSSSIVPKDDPTLLFTTAGMVQFKPMFAGTVDLEYTRAASIQKCFRTSDLEEVGKTKRHLTLFEMLGNFSFGDYFKKEAMEFAWEYSINVIKLPVDKVWVTVYTDDDEAYDIWKDKIGVSENRIVRLGKADNFWGPAGDSGACGPCSELYYDRGEAYGCGDENCAPGCECERYMEYWNLVFNQFNQDVNGVQTTLPRTGIDTGMGLERLATIVQGVDSVYETDELLELCNFVSSKTGVSYTDKNIIPIRVIVEHARAITFAMTDGIYPSNEGRGYVLRRVLRRALRFTRQIGVTEPFLYTLVDEIVNLMGEFYPDIVDSAPNIKNVIKSEEKRFLDTIESGMNRLNESIQKAKFADKVVISGKDAFQLYDTFGFPLEMTVEMANDENVEVDTKGFEAEMLKQKQRGKDSWKGAEGDLDRAFEELAKLTGDTKFLGYDETKCSAKITEIYSDSKIVQSIKQGDTALIVLNETSFYGESGGQIGDTGFIKSGNGFFRVDSTKKLNKTVIHIGELISGEFTNGETVEAEVDELKRNLIRANHTVTHLVQAALREVLGDHVKQAGSYVTADRMRFDFSHFNALTAEEILKIENIVNQKIWENIDVNTKVMNMDDAVKDGAMAVFDEKYGDVVRVVDVPGFSKELCGGTHVTNTGQIGIFKLLKETSPGAGVRRVEGVTLKGIFERYNEQNEIITSLSNHLLSTEAELEKKVLSIIEKNKTLEKELESLKKKSITSGVDDIIAKAEEVDGIKIISSVFDGVDVNGLRDLSDAIRSKEQNSVVLFGSAVDGKAMLLYAATKGAVIKGVSCGQTIKETAKLVGGGGGGRPDMAQAGGKNPAGVKDAIAEAVKIVKEMI